ncbi:phage tail terminator protein [Alkalibacterium sp. MB6]|uniref:phage tail terminator protein n=1 Tax=Alkalibacterium sp. MB6 TaxID=2081965 RepID=UPI0013797E63|nr:minor capsid protein [Alkalibacterium sp. MB6]
MDFMERLNEEINKIPLLPLQCRLGYLGADESLVMYPLAGSRTVAEYMDGEKEKLMNYEIAMKSKSVQKTNDTLWFVQKGISDIEDIKSSNGSFKFDEIVITNMPFINQADEQGNYVFLLDVQAHLTVFEKEEEIIND